MRNLGATLKALAETDNLWFCTKPALNFIPRHNNQARGLCSQNRSPSVGPMNHGGVDSRGANDHCFYGNPRPAAVTLPIVTEFREIPKLIETRETRNVAFIRPTRAPCSRTIYPVRFSARWRRSCHLLLHAQHLTFRRRDRTSFRSHAARISRAPVGEYRQRE